MSDYVTGFQTASGIKKYDYNSLANLPESGSDATNTVISPNADYAEVGEWVDGNPDRENRLGYFVAIAEVGDNTIKIRKAKSTDDIRGVSVYNPAFSGNASRDKYGEDGELLPQYNYIGLMGIVNIIDEGRCSVGGRCISNDDGIAVPSPNNMGYAVLERVDNRHVLIAIEPGADMIQRVKTDVVAIEESIDDMKANQDYYSIGLDYYLSGDRTYYMVTGPGTCKDVHLRIPSMYGGLPVKEIAYEAFSFCSTLESVEISEGVTSISAWAFNDCTGLKRVVIPKSVSHIGTLAFSGCRSLSQVIFDKSSMLDTIESDVFKGCSSLKSIEIPIGVSTIATGAFGGLSTLEKVIFPTSLIRIKADAFARSSSRIYVFYRGNSEDWDTVLIESPDDGNWGIANASMHYNYTDDFAVINEKLEQLSTGGGNVDLSAYQTKTDESLETDDKSVVGAINELNEKVNEGGGSGGGNYVSKYSVELTGSEKVTDIIAKLQATYPDYQLGVWSLIEFTGATNGLYGLIIQHYGGNTYNIGGMDFGTYYTTANNVRDWSTVSLWAFSGYFQPPIPYCDESNDGQFLVAKYDSNTGATTPTWATVADGDEVSY